MGLGDHFGTNGLIRTLVNRWEVDKLYIYCKEIYHANLDFMYRDDPRIELITIPCDTYNTNCDEAGLVHSDLRRRGINLKHHTAVDWMYGNSGDFYRLGHEYLQHVWLTRGSYVSNDQAFYLQAKVPYEYRFDKFFMRRNIDEEINIYKSLVDDGEEYVFVHNSTDKNIRWPQSLNDFHGKKIYNNPNIPLVKMGYLLENASEIYLTESSIRCMIEANLFNMTKPKLHMNMTRGAIWGNNTRHDWYQSYFENDEVLRSTKYPMYKGPNGNPTERGYFSEENG